MKEILLDTNVLISFLTDRNPEQQERADLLFRGAAERKYALILHSISLIEMVYVMTRLYKADPEDVSRSIASLLEMPGVSALSAVEWDLVLQRWPSVLPTLGDAIVAAVAAERRCDAVATFDQALKAKLALQGTSPYWSD
jgi:predicted nucleic acid-binding protein